MVVELDVQYAIEWTITHRKNLRAAREGLMQALQHLEVRVRPLSEAIRRGMAPSVKKVASAAPVAFEALM
eukprot:7903803-Lingulodinium_polyedra.AAC.1